MARPNTTRRSVRAQVAQRPSQPKLGVHAPLYVKTPGAETDPLWGLGQALGVVADLGGQINKQRLEGNRKQGMADEMIGDADMSRAEEDSSYADGAYSVKVLENYRDAEARAIERFSAEADRTLPVQEQLNILDGLMKSEMGGLAADPTAAQLIAPRYQEFIERTAGNILTEQAESRARAALEVTQQDAMAELEHTGTISWGDHWQRIASQTGDGTAATATLVGVVAQSMIDRAAAGDPNWASVRDAIPTEIVGPDGRTVRGPMHTPKHADTMQRAMIQAERAFHTQRSQQYATQDFKARVQLDGMLQGGAPITENTFKALGYTIGNDPDDTLSPALAAQYIQSSEALRAKQNQEAAQLQSYLDTRKLYGRWVDTTGMPGGPPSVEKTQKAFDGWTQQILLGSGLQLEQLGGAGMVESPELVDIVSNLAAQEGLPYGPLKRTMSEINQAAPGDVTARVDAYKVLKAKGVSAMFVNDDAALVYEVAIGAQEAGSSPEDVVDRIRTMGDRSTSEYVASNMRQLKVREKGFDIPAGTKWFGMGTGEVNSRKTQNAGYLASKYEQLVSSALSRELPLEAAEAYAQDRITQTHTALPIGEQWLVVPNAAVPNTQEATEAVDWYFEDQLPKLRERLKIPEDEEVTLQGRYDLNGRGLAFEVIRGGAGTGVSFSLPSLTQQYRTKVPKGSTARDEAIEISKGRQARREARREYADHPSQTISGPKY